jgi:hypothetical protein
MSSRAAHVSVDTAIENATAAIKNDAFMTFPPFGTDQPLGA